MKSVFTIFNCRKTLPNDRIAYKKYENIAPLFNSAKRLQNLNVGCEQNAIQYWKIKHKTLRHIIVYRFNDWMNFNRFSYKNVQKFMENRPKNLVKSSKIVKKNWTFFIEFLDNIPSNLFYMTQLDHLRMESYNFNEFHPHFNTSSVSDFTIFSNFKNII